MQRLLKPDMRGPDMQSAGRSQIRVFWSGPVLPSIRSRAKRGGCEGACLVLVLVLIEVYVVVFLVFLPPSSACSLLMKYLPFAGVR